MSLILRQIKFSFKENFFKTLKNESEGRLQFIVMKFDTCKLSFSSLKKRIKLII